MKKAIIIILLTATSFFANAQTDSLSVNDSIPLISIRQLNSVLTTISKSMTIDQTELYKFIIANFQKEIDKSIADLKRKKQK